MKQLLLILICVLSLSGPAHAESVKRYASIVVDADTLEIIHARQIDGQRFPASLTKVMTLYLTFDALNAGTLHLKEPLRVSRNAALTPPVDIGLRKGQTITVEQAIQALTVRSANDAAVVLAERIAGSEINFAAMMTAKARDLKMQRTTFMTPHGLPHPDQTTTARDMAKLASAMLAQHKRYYHYFGQTHFTWKGRKFKNTNTLLHWLAGVDGFKTGYTNASGYNLIISAERSGRRIIAVVLGGASGSSRDKHMQDLIERGFQAINVAPITSRRPITVVKATTPKTSPKMAGLTHAVRLRGRDSQPVTVVSDDAKIHIASYAYDQSWSIQIGAYSTDVAAKNQLLALSGMKQYGLSLDRSLVSPQSRRGQTLFRARFTNLTASQAEKACEALSHLENGCLVIAPSRG